MTGLTVDTRVVGPFQENCWLLRDAATGDCVLIDPGAEPELLLEMVRRNGGTLRAIWLTHAHLDHVGAIAGLKRAHPDVPVHLHPADLPVLRFAGRIAQGYGLPFEQPPDHDLPLAEGDTVRVGPHAFDVWHVPGHAPGHVAFVGGGRIFSGDVLFAGSIGRTDLPLCDPSALARSLDRLTTLDDQTEVFPGHGPTTTIGSEVRTNPFLTGAALIPGL